MNAISISREIKLQTGIFENTLNKLSAYFSSMALSIVFIFSILHGRNTHLPFKQT